MHEQGGDDVAAGVYMTTSQAGSFMSSDRSGFEEADFNPGEEGEIDYGTEGTNAEWPAEAYFSYYNEWSAANPDESMLLQGTAFSGVHVFGADYAFNLTWANSA